MFLIFFENIYKVGDLKVKKALVAYSKAFMSNKYTHKKYLLDNEFLL
jgi:hypothetical protein